jgi:hypothetical protein
MVALTRRAALAGALGVAAAVASARSASAEPTPDVVVDSTGRRLYFASPSAPSVQLSDMSDAVTGVIGDHLTLFRGSAFSSHYRYVEVFFTQGLRQEAVAALASAGLSEGDLLWLTPASESLADLDEASRLALEVTDEAGRQIVSSAWVDPTRGLCLYVHPWAVAGDSIASPAARAAFTNLHVVAVEVGDDAIASPAFAGDASAAAQGGVPSIGGSLHARARDIASPV